MINYLNKESIKLALIVILGVLFFTNSWILYMFYPKVELDYLQYIAFTNVRSVLYEAMFMLFFLLLMLMTKRMFRSISCFLFIMCTSSFVDKAIFNLRSFLITDILMLIVALGCAIYVYNRK
jgi:hypothetical protein